MSRRFLWIAAVVLLVSGGGGVWWLRAYPSPVPVPSPETNGKQTIVWSEPTLSVPLFPGTRSTMNIVFRSGADITNAVVEVTPSLQDMITISPTTFDSIIAGDQYQLTVTAIAPQPFVRAAVGGTLQIRNGAFPKNVYGTPLALKLKTDWRTFSLPTLGVILNYPPDWSAFQDEPELVALYDPDSLLDLSNGSAENSPDILVTPISNPSSLSLDAFVAKYDNGWFDAYTTKTALTIDGHAALLASDLLSAVPSTPELAAFIALDGTTVLFLGGHGNDQQQFESLLNSLSLP